MALLAVAIILGDKLLQPRTPEGPGLVALPAKIGGPFDLTDHRGQAVTEADFQGSFALLTFGYRSCPDFCPTNLATMAQALDELGAGHDRVAPLFLTLDPERDTAAALADYAPLFHERLTALTGTPDRVAEAAQGFRVIYKLRKDIDPVDYPVDHSTYTYLMDPDWQLLAVFRHSVTPERMAAVIADYL